MRSILKPITLVEVHGQPPMWHTVELLPEEASRDRTLRGKARIRARREAKRA